LALIKDAEEKKLISKGGTIVEGTAGNTGIGLCLIGNSRGYKTIIVMPETQTQEKKDILKSIGADLRLVPAKPYKDPNNYVKYSGKLAEDLKNNHSQGVFWANQFDNTANYKGHYETTGPEIWDQTEGKVDAFICSSGTGGTIAGVGTALKEKNKNIKIVLSDPKGSALYNHIKHGELKIEGKSITEGIGSSRVTKNFEQAPIDDAYSINDHDALTVLFELLEKEGLSLGTSTGINVAGAIKLAKDLGPNHTIVTILCDKSDIFRSKLFNKKFLKTYNEEPNKVSILGYDALGLIYYCWFNNNFQFKQDQLYNKQGFKGLHGEFIIEDNLSKQKLHIYKVSEKKFIKVH